MISPKRTQSTTILKIRRKSCCCRILMLHWALLVKICRQIVREIWMLGLIVDQRRYATGYNLLWAGQQNSSNPTRFSARCYILQATNPIHLLPIIYFWKRLLGSQMYKTRLGKGWLLQSSSQIYKNRPGKGLLLLLCMLGFKLICGNSCGQFEIRDHMIETWNLNVLQVCVDFGG